VSAANAVAALAAKPVLPAHRGGSLTYVQMVRRFKRGETPVGCVFSGMWAYQRIAHFHGTDQDRIRLEQMCCGYKPELYRGQTTDKYYSETE
jgi:hypothetical protein